MSHPIWSERARDDLIALDGHPHVGPDYADVIVEQALAAARFLAEHRHAGAALTAEVRKWSLRGCGFIMLYRPSGDCIQILRLLDARSDWRASFP